MSVSICSPYVCFHLPCFCFPSRTQRLYISNLLISTEQAIVTIIIIPYTFIAPRRLPSFYHVYGEVALEFFLFFFWLVSFASMADYVGTFDWTQAAMTSATAGLDPLDPGIESQIQADLPPWVHNIYKGMNALKGVTVFGSVLL
jgi:hypothetical protein